MPRKLSLVLIVAAGLAATAVTTAIVMEVRTPKTEVERARDLFSVPWQSVRPESPPWAGLISDSSAEMTLDAGGQRIVFSPVPRLTFSAPKEPRMKWRNVFFYLVSENREPPRLCAVLISAPSDVIGIPHELALKYLDADETEEVLASGFSADRKAAILKDLGSGGDVPPAVARKDVDFLLHLTWAQPFSGVRYHAIVGLGEIGPEAAPATPFLRRYMVEMKHGGRAAVEALAKIGDEAAIEPMCYCLRASLAANLKEYDHAALVSALGSFGPRAVAAVPLIAKVLDHPQYAGNVKVALEALARIGPTAASAAPQIREQLRMQYADEALRTVAKVGCGDAVLEDAITGRSDKIDLIFAAVQTADTERVLKMLTEMLRSGQKQRTSCWRSLKLLEAYGSRALPALPAILEFTERQEYHGDWTWRIAEAIAPMGPDAVPSLLEVLKGKSIKQKLVVIIALSKMTHPAAAACFPYIVAEIKSPSPEDPAAYLSHYGHDAIVAVSEAVLKEAEAGNLASFGKAGTDALEHMRQTLPPLRDYLLAALSRDGAAKVAALIVRLDAIGN